VAWQNGLILSPRRVAPNKRLKLAARVD